MFVGTDIGGTFTDVAGYDPKSGKLTFGKKLTHRSDLVDGVLSCLDDVSIPLAASASEKGADGGGVGAAAPEA